MLNFLVVNGVIFMIAVIVLIVVIIVIVVLIVCTVHKELVMLAVLTSLIKTPELRSQ